MKPVRARSCAGQQDGYEAPRVPSPRWGRRGFLFALAAAPLACGKGGGGMASTDLYPAKLFADEVAAKSAPPLFHVGPAMLFRKERVPGAIATGEGGDPEGLATLTRAVADLPKDKPVVIYCGCCPFRNCPNVSPALATLKRLGFSQAKILDLPTTFRADWVEKGFPVERG